MIIPDSSVETQVDVTGFSRQSLQRTDSTDDDVLLNSIYQKLIQLMSRDQPYLNNDLSLADLANRLSINPRLLSQAINKKAQAHFYDFVNQYRVEAFKHRVGQPDALNRLIDLAFACGFNSKATFNHVFKKCTGLTPSEYRNRLNRS